MPKRPENSPVLFDVLDTLPSWGTADDLRIDDFTGACTYEIPIRIPPGRSDFTPQLSLTYNSGRRNSPFGWGWQLHLPSIGRRVWPFMPKYTDSDVFSLSDDELVPALRVSGGWIDDRFTVGEYVVQRFRRRYEGPHDRIERWTHQPSNQTHWRVIDKDNVTSQFGTTDESRVSDPDDPTRVLQWLLTEQFDDRGNIIRYTYKRETFETAGGTPQATRYVKRVQYGNDQPHERSNWHFEIVFDYGDHHQDDPQLDESREWLMRPDVYSSNRGGFELQWLRRCKRVLVFHRFAELGESPVLVSSTDFGYDDQSGRSLLASLTASGYMQRPNNPPERRSLPSLELHYQNAALDEGVHELSAPKAVAALADESLRAHWFDLHGEAMPGILLWRNNSWHYMRNLGGGEFADAVAVQDAMVADEITRINLIEGNQSPEVPPEPPANTASFIDGDANLRVNYIDLNGDDFDDVVVADNNQIRWYPSRHDESFADPIVLQLKKAATTHPQFLHAQEDQVFFAADMNGDGLYDIVRVRRNEVTYWPHFGHGCYGSAITMNGVLDMPTGALNGNSVLLTDLTTTGSADLVWVGDGEIRYWENLDGVRFGIMHQIHAPGVEPQASHVSATDLFGRAADCIVWVDQRENPRQPTLRYIAPVGDRQPDLLSGVDNGRGLETRISYVSTSELRRRDRIDGMDQLATLPRSVQVVERVERRDYIAHTRELRRFVFRHASWDPERQIFVGFGAQDLYYSGNDNDYNDPGLFPHEPVPAMHPLQRSAPTLVRRWFHTGLMFEGEDLTAELATEWFVDPVAHRHTWLSGHLLPLGQQASEIPASYRALTGKLLRQEFYEGHAESLYSQSITPARIQEHTWRVVQTQPGRSGHASFTASRNEEIVVHREGNSDTPRIEHTVILGVDDFGHEIRTATVNYGLADTTDESQRATHMVVDELSLANRSDQATWYRIGVPIEHVRWSVVGHEAPEKGLFSPTDLRAIFDKTDEVPFATSRDGTHKKRVSQTRLRYWANDLSRMLESGRVESRALAARVESAAFPAEFAKQIFGDDPTTSELLSKEGGYELKSGQWWAIGDTVTYDSGRFYLPVTWRDAQGRELAVQYDDKSLGIKTITDAYGNSSASELHPRVLMPWKFTDVNNNVTALRFDVHGSPLSCAVMGKVDQPQGDVLALDRLEATGADDPTVVITYDAHAYAERGEPVWVRHRRRDRHRDPDTTLDDAISFFDGHGRLLATSERVGNKWRVVSLFQRDDRGQLVRSGGPAFVDRPFPNQSERESSFGQGEQYFFDAFGRLAKVRKADGSLRLTEHEPWQSVISDGNDAVMESDWYARRSTSLQGRAGDFSSRAEQQYEARAAALSATHAQTPAIELYDARCRVVTRKYSVASQQELLESFVYDCEDRLTHVIDATGNTVRETAYDMLGNVIKEWRAAHNAEVLLRDTSGNMLRHQTSDGEIKRFVYDQAGRITHVYSTSSEGEEALIQRTIWGGGDVTVSEARDRNLVNMPHVQLTGLGLESIDVCDWNGNVVRASFQLANERVPTPDWSVAADIKHAGQVTAFLASTDIPMLDSNLLVVDTIFDAASRPVFKSVADTVTLNYEYAESRKASSIRARVEGIPGERTIVQDVKYDEAGRAIAFTYGDGTVIGRKFDEEGRVTRVRANTPASGSEHVYDISVLYDANGNVMTITDHGKLVASFTYDGMNRLTKAECVDPSLAVESFDYDEAGNVKDIPASPDERVLEIDSYGRFVRIADDEATTTIGYGSRPGLLRRVINSRDTLGVGDRALIVDDITASNDGSQLAVRFTIDGITVGNLEIMRDADGAVAAQSHFYFFDIENAIVEPEQVEPGTLNVNGLPYPYQRPPERQRKLRWAEPALQLDARSTHLARRAD